MARAKAIKDMKAREIMSDVLVMLESDMTAKEAAQIFKRNRITGAPVVDEAGQVAGVLSVTDLMAKETGADLEAKKATGYYHQSDLVTMSQEVGAYHANTPVAEIMEREFVSAPSSAPVAKLASLMLQKKIRRVLIIDNRRLVGIVTQTDILKAVAHQV